MAAMRERRRHRVKSRSKRISGRLTVPTVIWTLGIVIVAGVLIANHLGVLPNLHLEGVITTPPKTSR
jgi:hypothetical protein